MITIIKSKFTQQTVLGIIFCLLLIITSCGLASLYMTWEITEQTYTDYCWISPDVIAYAMTTRVIYQEQVFLDSDTLEMTSRFSVYSYDFNTGNETLLFASDSSNIDKKDSIDRIFAINDTVYIQQNNIIYTPESVDCVRVSALSNLIGDYHFIRESDDNRKLFFSDSTFLYKINRDGSGLELINEILEYKIIDYFDTSVGRIIVYKKGTREYLYHMYMDYIIPVRPFRGEYDVVWHEWGESESKTVHFSSPEHYRYYTNNRGFLECNVTDTITGNNGLCRVDITDCYTTHHFYNGMTGVRSPSLDKFVIMNDGLFVVDSLRNVLLNRPRRTYHKSM